MWKPSRAFKGTFTAVGFFVVSVFLIGLFAAQCGLWVLIPIVAFVVALHWLERRRH